MSPRGAAELLVLRDNGEGNAADCSRALEGAEIDRAIVDYATAFLRGAPQPAIPTEEE